MRVGEAPAQTPRFVDSMNCRIAVVCCASLSDPRRFACRCNKNICGGLHSHMASSTALSLKSLRLLLLLLLPASSLYALFFFFILFFFLIFTSSLACYGRYASPETRQFAHYRHPTKRCVFPLVQTFPGLNTSESI